MYIYSACSFRLMCLKIGRWGEAEKEKCPVNIFPAEPTDVAALRQGDLEPWVQGTRRRIKQKGPYL